MKNILIHKDDTILQALKKLNSIRDVSRLILFVYDDDKSIIGSLTDGDVRRSLVKHSDLNIVKQKISIFIGLKCNLQVENKSFRHF